MDAFQLTVAHNLSIGVIDHQTAKQGNEGGTLCRSAGIVMTGMHANLILGAGLIEMTVALYVVVVTDAFAVETGIVIVTEHIDGVALVATGC